MHQRLIVASSQSAEDFNDIDSKVIPFNKATSAEVSLEVANWLNENSFSSEGGRWNSSPADWYVIGGRWSGELDKLEYGVTWDDLVSHLKSLLTKEELEKYDERFVNSEHLKKYKLALDKWWQEKANSTESTHPWLRDNYFQGGHSDSRPLTKKLWKGLENEFSYQGEESWIMIDKWVRHTKDENGGKGIWYDDTTEWKDLKDKAVDYDEDDFLSEDDVDDKDQIWLTVVDYHY